MQCQTDHKSLIASINRALIVWYNQPTLYVPVLCGFLVAITSKYHQERTLHITTCLIPCVLYHETPQLDCWSCVTLHSCLPLSADNGTEQTIYSQNCFGKKEVWLIMMMHLMSGQILAWTKFLNGCSNNKELILNSKSLFFWAWYFLRK